MYGERLDKGANVYDILVIVLGRYFGESLWIWLKYIINKIFFGKLMGFFKCEELV